MGGKALNGKTITNNNAYDLFKKIVDSNNLKDKSKKILLCGSARRGKNTCGDLDIVFIDDKNNSLKHWLSEVFGFKKNGKPQTVGLIDGVQIEFYESTEECWGSQVLMWTGSASNNIRLRRICKKRGWTMSQYGIKDSTKRNLTSGMSEQEIYTFLGIEYLEPEER
tara:strand:- start:7732 stop:8229 length:498 start_codon:yes stop_codon:yes gene_type:complete